MGKKIQDIQTIIDRRAQAKLDADLMKMSETITNFPLFRNMNDGGSMPGIFGRVESKPGFENETPVYKEHSVYDFFSAYQNRGGDPVKYSNYMAKLRAYWLTEYIQRETLDFFNRVDQLATSVNELLDAKNQTHDY